MYSSIVIVRSAGKRGPVGAQARLRVREYYHNRRTLCGLFETLWRRLNHAFTQPECRIVMSHYENGVPKNTAVSICVMFVYTSDLPGLVMTNESVL